MFEIGIVLERRGLRIWFSCFFTGLLIFGVLSGQCQSKNSKVNCLLSW